MDYTSAENRDQKRKLDRLAPDAAVVIPAYNEELRLPAALNSVLASLQEFENSSDCGSVAIVVDNGSDDRTAEIARDMGAFVFKLDKPNIPAARQHGLTQAPNSVNWVLSTDADTRVPKQWVKNHVRKLEEEGTIGTYGHYLLAPISDQIPHSHLLLLETYAVATLGFRELKRLNGISIWRGSNQAFHRSDILQLGGYNLKFHSGSDAELLYRVSKLHPGSVVFAPRTTVLSSPRRILGKGLETHFRDVLQMLLTAKIEDGWEENRTQKEFR